MLLYLNLIHLLDWFLRLLLKFCLDYLWIVSELCLLDQLPTDVNHHVVVICTVWAFFLKKCELCIVLLSLENHLLEL